MVMPRSIQVRNVPDDIHRTLRARAAEAGMSLSEYLLAEITRSARRPTIAQVLERAGRRPGGASVEEIVEAVRSGRPE
jgi:plasmid stability protein